MYLLRMHEDRAAFERVQCADLRREARLLLDVERDRLAAVAPPPAHTPTPDPTMATMAHGSPAPAAAAVPGEAPPASCKRPPGRSPRGTVWVTGEGWVDRATLHLAPPANKTSSVGRPKDPPKKERQRSSTKGVFVSQSPQHVQNVRPASSENTEPNPLPKRHRRA